MSTSCDDASSLVPQSKPGTLPIWNPPEELVFSPISTPRKVGTAYKPFCLRWVFREGVEGVVVGGEWLGRGGGFRRSRVEGGRGGGGGEGICGMVWGGFGRDAPIRPNQSAQVSGSQWKNLGHRIGKPRKNLSANFYLARFHRLEAWSNPAYHKNTHTHQTTGFPTGLPKTNGKESRVRLP